MIYLNIARAVWPIILGSVGKVWIISSMSSYELHCKYLFSPGGAEERFQVNPFVPIFLSSPLLSDQGS